MSFTFPDKTAIIDFPDTYPGLEVVVRLSPIPITTFLDFHAEIIKLLDSDTIDGRLRWGELAGRWAPVALVSWNLEAPPDPAGILGQPWEFLSALLQAWARGVAEVPLPLGRRSSDGTPSTKAASHRSSTKRSSTTASSDAIPATP